MPRFTNTLHPPAGRVARYERGGRACDCTEIRCSVMKKPSPAVQTSDPPARRVENCDQETTHKLHTSPRGGIWRRCKTRSSAKTNIGCFILLGNPRQLAQVCFHDRLWAAPNQKEKRFAAPLFDFILGITSLPSCYFFSGFRIIIICRPSSFGILSGLPNSLTSSAMCFN